jgi:phosphomannomutase
MAALPTRDAVLPALEVLVAAAKSSVSNLVANLPNGVTLSDRLQQVNVSYCQQRLADAAKEPQNLLDSLAITIPFMSLDLTDGWRCYLQDQSVVHLRLSGNAPEMRIYVEAIDIALAEQLLAQVLLKLPSILTD